MILAIVDCCISQTLGVDYMPFVYQHGMCVSFPVHQILCLLSDSIPRNLECLIYARRLKARQLVCVQRHTQALGEELADGNGTSVDVRYIIGALKFFGNLFAIHNGGEVEGSGAVGANRTALGCNDSTRDFKWDVVVYGIYFVDKVAR